LNLRRESLDLIVTETKLPEVVELEEGGGEVAEVVGVQEELLEAAGVSHDVLRHIVKGAVTLIHILNLSVAPLEEGDALEHGELTGVLPLACHVSLHYNLPASYFHLL